MVIILTCETPGCLNENIGIPYTDPADTCVCGVCMNEITNKKPAADQPAT